MKKTVSLRHLVQLAGAALLIHAASATAAPEMGQFLNGGIGIDGRQAMHAQRQHYNLRLRFAQARTGEYVSGVSVTIAPAGKKGARLHFEDAGPLLYVRLQPGSYRISALYKGMKQVRTVDVGRSPTNTLIHWP